MSRWIDADELKVDIKLSYNTFPSAPQFGTISSQYGVTMKQIEDAPSIDIVRCKECALNYDDTNYCEYHEHNVMPNDFCSYGERRDRE